MLNFIVATKGRSNEGIERILPSNDLTASETDFLIRQLKRDRTLKQFQIPEKYFDELLKLSKR